MTRPRPATRVEQYITIADIAEAAGMTLAATRQLHKRSTGNRASGKPGARDLPPEDIRLGLTPGWKRATIDPWLTLRNR